MSAKASDQRKEDVQSHKKLQGFDFWRQSLNAAKLVVAPMVDQSELAWRMLSRKYKADLCYTPMYHAAVFSRDERYRREALVSCKEDRPLIIQFCGNDPEIFLKAAKLAEDHCDAIDINLGCPQQIAKRGHYGAFLQDEWELLHKIVSLCHEQLKVPITAKVRIYTDIGKTVEYAKMLEKAGCQLLTVHGRIKEQKGPKTGLASWAHIKAVKENVKIPVFANGNIQYLEDVHRCIDETGVDGVMTAEGNLHNPALFTGLQPPVWEMAEEYLEFVDKYPCSLSYVRGHIFKIMVHAVLVHQEARALLGAASSLDEIKQAVSIVKESSKDDVLKYKNDPNSFKSALPYPYWICQPYVRPPVIEDSYDKNPPCKRPTEEVNVQPNDQENGKEGLSKNQLKKLKRNPHKKFDRRIRTFDKCQTCGNPRGIKCEFELCRSCCKKKCFKDIADCRGHSILFKTHHDFKRKEEDTKSETCDKKDNENIMCHHSLNEALQNAT